MTRLLVDRAALHHAVAGATDRGAALGAVFVALTWRVGVYLGAEPVTAIAVPTGIAVVAGLFGAWRHAGRRMTEADLASRASVRVDDQVALDEEGGS